MVSLSAPAKLRALETLAVERDARELVELRDPLTLERGLAQTSLALTSRAWSIACRFDGVADVQSIARDAQATQDEVESVAAELRSKLLLDDDDARAAIADESRRFRALAARPAIGAGRDYPADPIDLRIQVAGRVADDWDMPPPPDAAGAWTPASGLRLAGALHARTWAALRHFKPRFARVVMLGAVRAQLASELVALDKPIDTPLGAVAPDAAALAALPRCDELEVLVHRGHGAFELQCLFLRVLMPALPAVAVLVPSSSSAASVAASLARLDALEGRTLWLACEDLGELHDDAAAAATGSPGFARGPAAHQQGQQARDRIHLVVRERAAEAERALDRDWIDALTKLDRSTLERAAAASTAPSRRATANLIAVVAHLLHGRVSPVDRSPLRGSLLGYAQFADRGVLRSAASVLLH